MKHIIWVLWPAFIAAGIAEVVFFTVIDPQQLYLLGQPMELPVLATYSIGFLMFWLICSGSSLMTYFMLPQAIKNVLDSTANKRSDLARPVRTPR
jgi:fructose-specific phosphotransferase system IIC component